MRHCGPTSPSHKMQRPSSTIYVPKRDCRKNGVCVMQVCLVSPHFPFQFSRSTHETLHFTPSSPRQRWHPGHSSLEEERGRKVSQNRLKNVTQTRTQTRIQAETRTRDRDRETETLPYTQTRRRLLWNVCSDAVVFAVMCDWRTLVRKDKLLLGDTRPFSPSPSEKDGAEKRQARRVGLSHVGKSCGRQLSNLPKRSNPHRRRPGTRTRRDRPRQADPDADEGNAKLARGAKESVRAQTQKWIVVVGQMVTAHESRHSAYLRHLLSPCST